MGKKKERVITHSVNPASAGFTSFQPFEPSNTAPDISGNFSSQPIKRFWIRIS